MKFRDVLLLACLIIIAQLVQAQTNYLPGSVVSLDGKLQTGLIDYREWRVNPRKISFIQQAGGEPVAYTVADLAAFTINEKDSFVRAIVLKDMNPVENLDVINEVAGGEVRDTVFLRMLVQGKIVSLFELIDSKPHYYIREKDADYQELGYKVTSTMATTTAYLEHSRLYRNQLQKYTFNHADEARINGYLEKADYRERDLVKVIAAINKVTVQRKKESTVNFFASGGPVIASFDTEGNTPLKSFSYETNTGFTIGAGMEMAAYRNLHDLVFRLDLFYTSVKYNGAGRVENYITGHANGTYSIKQNSITPGFAVLYRFIRKPNFKMYAGPGIEYNFSSYPENLYRLQYINEDKTFERTDMLELTSAWLMFSGRLGAIIANKFEVGVWARLTGNFERASAISAIPTLYSLRVAYRFKRNL